MAIEHYIAGFAYDQGSNVMPNAACEALSYWNASGDQSSFWLDTTNYNQGSSSIGFGISLTNPGTTGVYSADVAWNADWVYTGYTYRYIIPGSRIKRSAGSLRVAFGYYPVAGYYRISEAWIGPVANSINFDGRQARLTFSGSIVGSVSADGYLSDQCSVVVNSGQPLMISAYFLPFASASGRPPSCNSLGMGYLAYSRGGSDYISANNAVGFSAAVGNGTQMFIKYINDVFFFGDNYIYRSSPIPDIYVNSEYLIEADVYPTQNGRYTVSLVSSAGTIFSETRQFDVGYWNRYSKVFTFGQSVSDAVLFFHYAGAAPPDTVYLDNFYGGVNRSHRSIGVIQIYPEWDMKRFTVQNREDHRTRGGKMFSYKWGDYERLEVPIEYISDSKAAIINSWWATDALIYFKIYSGGVWQVNTCYLMNDGAPFDIHPKPYDQYFNGRLELETF